MYFTLENMITYWKYMRYFLDIPKDVLDTSVARIQPFIWFSVIVREDIVMFCGHCFNILKLNIYTQAHPYTLFQPFSLLYTHIFDVFLFCLISYSWGICCGSICIITYLSGVHSCAVCVSVL